MTCLQFQWKDEREANLKVLPDVRERDRACSDLGLPFLSSDYSLVSPCADLVGVVAELGQDGIGVLA